MDPRDPRNDDDNQYGDVPEDHEQDDGQNPEYADGNNDEEYDQYEQYEGVNEEPEAQEESEAQQQSVPPEEESNDDFPEYANEHNKQLNQIVKTISISNT